MSLINELRQKAATIRSEAATKAGELTTSAENEAKDFEAQATNLEQMATTRGGLFETLLAHGSAELREVFDELKANF